MEFVYNCFFFVFFYLLLLFLIRMTLNSFEITEHFIVNHEELKYNSCIVLIIHHKLLQKAKWSHLSRELSIFR